MTLSASALPQLNVLIATNVTAGSSSPAHGGFLSDHMEEGLVSLCG